jgi:hypothetical protein
MEYPTSLVQIQYTTVSVGITSPGPKFFCTTLKNLSEQKDSTEIGFKLGEMPIQSGG